MRYTKYTKELLEPLVKDSVTYSEVCRKLGKLPKGATWDLIKSKIAKFQIDVSHFLGKAAHAGGRQTGKARKHLPEEVLVNGKMTRERGKRLRNALIESGRDYKCERCDVKDTWCGEPITLEVDHIDWNWRNCEKNNLRFLCPNCHSQRKKWTVS